MKYIYTLLMVLFIGLCDLKAQEVSADTAVVSKIKNYESTHSRIMDILSYISDIYGPRLTFSPEFKEAADWVSGQMKQWGLENVHFDPWSPMGKGWTLKSFYAEVTSPRVIPLIAFPNAWSPGFDKPVTGDVIYMDVSSPGELQQYKGKLKGKFVLVSKTRELSSHFTADAERYTDSALLAMSNAFPEQRRGRVQFPRLTMDNFDSVFAYVKMIYPGIDSARMSRYLMNRVLVPKIMEFCKNENALAALTESQGDDGTIFVQQSQVPQPAGNSMMASVNAYDPEVPAIIPQVVVSSEQYNRIVRMLGKGEKVSMKMELNVAWTPPVNGFNIIGEIPGSDLKDQVVMIGAHFDSWHSGTGATDNGTGSAVCLEAMRILKALNLQTRRTIRIGLWAGEEEGLIGSRKYVAETFAKNNENNDMTILMQGHESNLEKTPAYDNFSVYLNDDNGAGKFRGIYLQGNEAARSIFREWLHEFDDPDAQTITISNTGGTDHLSFDAVGLPGFQFIQDPLDYETRTHHSNQDVYDRIPEKDVEQAAEMMAYFAYKAAMMDSLFPRNTQ